MEEQLDLPLPFHKHDCEEPYCCRYVTSYIDHISHKKVDVYISGDVILHRYSSDGPDYISTNVRYMLRQP